MRGTRSRTTAELSRAVALGAITCGFAACSGAHPAATTIAPVPSCVVGAARPSGGGILSVATTAPVDPAHVPEPTNAAERLAFAQVYETLIDVDCDGGARPALAASWAVDATKTRVTLTLRKGAQFWTGEPVTAASVLAAWRATAARPAPVASLARQIASGATVVDDHTLIVSLPDTSWLVLGEPALAVYEQQPTAVWPAGSGPYRPAASPADAPPGAALVLAPSAPADPSLLIRSVPSGDPRDAIDAGADVLVTGDPAIVAYAAARGNFAPFPLPWTRTYAVVLPAATPNSSSMRLQPDSDSVALRESLARDAVHAEARAAQAPFWWDDGRACGTMVDSTSAARATDGRANRIVYERDDAIARGLAERLVALDPHTIAAALAPDDYVRAMRAGNDLAYVLALPRVSLSACADLGKLLAFAPWLAGNSAADRRLVPLIDTRETALVRQDRVSATFDWRGTLHFSGLGSRP